jgi:hypothetical protein
MDEASTAEEDFWRRCAAGSAAKGGKFDARRAFVEYPLFRICGPLSILGRRRKACRL